MPSQRSVVLGRVQGWGSLQVPLSDVFQAPEGRVCVYACVCARVLWGQSLLAVCTHTQGLPYHGPMGW